MTRLFQPKCELNVFVEGALSKYGKRAKKYVITDLHMEFDIELFAAMGKKAATNTARITVYNLAKATRDLFSEAHQGIEFHAGYGDDTGLIFAGQTTNVLHERIDNGYATTIYAGDGIKQFETQYFGKSYSAGTPVIQILTDMCTNIGLPFSIDTLGFDVLLSGETYSGMTKDCLDTVCKDRGLEWSIHYGVLELKQKDSPFSLDPTAILISSSSGMIGWPTIIEKTRTTKKKRAKKKNKKTFDQLGVRVQTLLNYQIKPSRLIKIQADEQSTDLGDLFKKTAPSKDVNGVYVSDIVRHFGDNFGGAFLTEVEADLQ